MKQETPIKKTLVKKKSPIKKTLVKPVKIKVKNKTNYIRYAKLGITTALLAYQIRNTALKIDYLNTKHDWKISMGNLSFFNFSDYQIYKTDVKKIINFIIKNKLVVHKAIFVSGMEKLGLYIYFYNLPDNVVYTNEPNCKITVVIEQFNIDENFGGYNFGQRKEEPECPKEIKEDCDKIKNSRKEDVKVLCKKLKLKYHPDRNFGKEKEYTEYVTYINNLCEKNNGLNKI